ncbi:hypothetical protein J7U46_10835 [Pelomonas sp. V22]|uniref:hypothetical protein n=1 Tax=Pelomonas sp. V22 TaxID=2822139 RepID=UPI0024A82688|nr:hypothetical protein [Pelomonas sp. V22]MDI4633543.1 hypothetical protein [Pelomonas sp. V22]
MRRFNVTAFTALVGLLCAPVFAQQPAANPVLAELKAQDQAARSGAIKDIDWKKISAEDAARRVKVLDLIKQGGVRSAEDYCNAALIFQHGETVDEIRLAYSLATTSRALDPADKRCRWLSAAAWDRLLMRLNKPQWYGTQFTKSSTGPWELYLVDETAVSDAERAELGVPPLAEARARAAKIQ